jgi:hypothetical protein
VAGCGSSASGASNTSGYAGSGPVQILGQGVVGPYETVTLRSSDPNALTNWLVGHSFDIPASIAPTIDAYVVAGFDFIALRLRPTCGVQAMKPVRVRTPGADPTLPLRMVAAGVGANVDVDLWVVGEGRWEPQNFPSATIDETQLLWDRAQNASNYASLVESTMAQANGTTWVTEYAGYADVSMTGVSSYGGNPGLAQAYFAFCGGAQPTNGSTIMQPQPCTGSHALSTSDAGLAETGSADGPAAEANADADTDADASTENDADSDADTDANGDAEANDAAVGVDAGDDAAEDGGATGDDGGTSDEGGPVYGGGPSGTCADYDDLAVATTDIYANDVWVTRLRAKLPVEALAKDLILQASSPQVAVSNVHQTYTYTQGPQQAQACQSGPGGRGGAFEGVSLIVLTAAVAGALRRQRRS